MGRCKLVTRVCRRELCALAPPLQLILSRQQYHHEKIGDILLCFDQLYKMSNVGQELFGGDEEKGTLSDTFLASPVNEEAQATVYSGERAFSVNLIKSIFEKYENESIEENIFISPSSI